MLSIIDKANINQHQVLLSLLGSKQHCCITSWDQKLKCRIKITAPAKMCEMSLGSLTKGRQPADKTLISADALLQKTKNKSHHRMNCDHIKTHLYASNLKRFKKPLRRKKRWQWGLGKGAKDLRENLAYQMLTLYLALDHLQQAHCLQIRY